MATKPLSAFDLLFYGLNGITPVSYQKDNYPPHSLWRKGDNEFHIEMAVAGFNKDELDVQIHDSSLTISGEKVVKVEEREPIYTGIAYRTFSKSFPIAKNTIINKATLEDGILKIELIRPTEEKKSTRVNIK